MVAAIDEILAFEGPGICGTRYGRALGRGLCELRVRHSAAELRARFQPHGLDTRPAIPSAAGDRGGILLRLFFHPHGDRQILVLAGYDKGVRPSARRQSKQIQLARRRLADHRRRHRM
jgi:hypothetical protein